MKSLSVVLMRSSDTDRFTINDINELASYYDNIYLFTLRKKKIFFKKEDYKENVKLFEPKNLSFSFYDSINIIVKFFKVLLIISASKDLFTEKLKMIFLLPRCILIYNYLKIINPDHVHFFWGHYPSLISIVFGKNRHFTSSTFLGAYDLRKFLEVTKKSVIFNDIVFTHSNSNIPILKNFLKHQIQIARVYRGINFEDFQYHDYRKKKLTFACAGEFEDHKNFGQIICIFNKILKKYSNSKLYIIGKGYLRKDLVQKVKSFGIDKSVVFTGWLGKERYSKILSESHFFLHLSKIEVLPNVVKEAMYCKCICISSKTFAIEELIQNDINGYLIDLNNEDEIIKIVETHKDNLNSKIAQNARNLIIEKFDIKKNIKLFYDKISNIKKPIYYKKNKLNELYSFSNNFFKIIFKKKPNIFFGVFLPVYFVAGLSFGLSVIRDFIIYQNFNNYDMFFQILYTCSIATISINAIIFSSRKPNILTFIIHTLITFILIFIVSKEDSLAINLLYCFLATIWIIGTFAQRDMLINNDIVLSRTRDLISSFFIILLITTFNKINLINAALLGYFITLIFTLLIMQIINNKKKIIVEDHLPSSFLDNLKDIFLTTASMVLFNFWALNETYLNSSFFGYDKAIIVRISFYFYAFFQIGTLLIKYINIPKIVENSLIFVALSIFAFYYLFLPSYFDVIIFPISCTILNIALISKTNQKNATFRIE
jgi:glycosyltransferase involved in cell wall biosynthesis